MKASKQIDSAAEQESFRLDGLKWLIVVAIVAGGVYGNWYYANEPLLYRVLALVALAILAALAALKTRKGANVWSLLKGARTEARRVVWPNQRERNQTTLIVVGVVFVMSLILWGLDSLFSWLASIVIG